MNPNPYDLPNTPCESPRDIVDRRQRDDFATVVRRFLDEDVTVFDFDELLKMLRIWQLHSR